MEYPSSSKNTCNCDQLVHLKPLIKRTKGKKISIITSGFLSILIAFVPKCPGCLAAYLSMFGSVAVLNIPDMKWLLPLLMVFLCIHLIYIHKKIREKGYGPFLLSAAGAIILILDKTTLPLGNTIVYAGIICIIVGSLWNNFYIKFDVCKIPRNTPP